MKSKIIALSILVATVFSLPSYATNYLFARELPSENWGTVSTYLTNHNEHVLCTLNKVEFEDTGGGTEISSCKIEIVNDAWYLVANATGADNEVLCKVYCYGH